MSSIGIGITTYNRPEMLKKCLEHIKKHTFNGYATFEYSDSKSKMLENYLDSKIEYRAKGGYNITIYVADDSIDRKGVAYRKNECLRALKDCDYIFLFDDDCYPIRDGWVEFFLELPYHWLFLNDKMHTYLGGNTYKDCGGVFMMLTKEIIESVGAFNEEFGLWGFEHAEYSQRVYRAGFTLQPYMCKEGTENYLYAEDYSNPNHKSSITNEEKNLLFRKNFPKFAKGIERIYIPL